ncbi:hypothetical protein HDV06_001654 [Boothiomyces sp. JEL0866]|nr:hypothetical protein HDV06_001654 [Boothiomyces sp. JEL0866]
MSFGLVPFLQFNWQSSDCAGPPSSIFAYNYDANSTILGYINSDTGFDVCSTDKIVPADNCCKSSLNTTATMGYQASAGTYTYTGGAFNNLSLTHLYPKAASNAKYCTIKGLNNSYLEYDTGFYLSSNQCFQDFLKCSSNTLYVYNGKQCTGNVERFNIDSLSNFSSSVIGDFEAKMTTMGNGILYYTWVAIYPTVLYYPLNKDPLELLGTISQVIAIAIPIFGILYILKNIFTARKVIFTQIVITCYYQAPADLSIQNESLILTLSSYLQATCMLIGMMTEMYVLDKLVLNLSFKYSLALYCIIFLLNIGLEGWVYPLYPAVIDMFENNDPTLFLLTVQWRKMTESIQILFWLLFGIATCIAVTVKIILYDKNYKTQTVIGKLVVAFKDIYLLLPMILHLLTLTLYYITNYIVANTTLAGNDRAQTGLVEFESFFLAAHIYITCFSFDYFKTTLQQAIDNRGKPSTQKSSKSSKVKPVPLKKFIDSEASKQSTKTVNDRGTIKM